MFNEFLQKTQILYRDNEPFAIASVINRQLPSSGKPGDKAVIDKEGRITGWAHDSLSLRNAVFFDGHASSLPSTDAYWMDTPRHYRGPTDSGATWLLHPREVEHLLWFVDPQDVTED